MNNSKDTLLLHASLWHQIKMLNDVSAGRLFKVLLRYGFDGTEPTFEDDFTLRIVWAGIKAQLDENAEKYEARCQRNKENVRKRWAKNNTNVNDGTKDIQSNTTVNDCKTRIPNDMICSDMICSDMSSNTQLSSSNEESNVCVCENNQTHTRTHEVFLSFQKQYKKSCPRLAKSDMKQPDEEGVQYMLSLCDGDTSKVLAILTQMNNKRKVTTDYTSVTQTFKAFYDRLNK